MVSATTADLGTYRQDIKNALLTLGCNPVEQGHFPPDARTSGPFSQAMVALDGNIQLTLTGGKSWHRMAPYLGVGIGISFGSDIPEDSSGFTFNAKFLLQPAAGIRFHLSNRLIVSAEARDLLWRLSYPQSYLLGPEPILDGSIPRSPSG